MRLFSNHTHKKLNIGFGRVYWIDNLKAVGIIFILLGHTDGISKTLGDYIFSFHVPLFFFLSGCLFRKTNLQLKFISFVNKYLESLIIPYIFFGLSTYILWVVYFRYYGGNTNKLVDPLKPLIGMLYGVGTDNWLYHNTPLWFFPCLFSTHFYFYLLVKNQRKSALIFALLTCGIFGYLTSTYLNYRLPWEMDTALTAIVFYGCGYWAVNNSLLILSPKLLTQIIIIIICFFLQIVSIKMNSRVDMNYNYYGNIVLFYIGAFSGIFFWLYLVQLLPRTRVLSAIGASTIVVFPLHLLIFKVITGFAVLIIGVPLSFLNKSILVSILYTLIALVILVPLAKFMRVYMPWLIGAKT